MAETLNILPASGLLHGDKTRQVREFRLESESIDSEKRTAAFSFSSEFPVLRADFAGNRFWEVLDHGSVDMSRISDGAPLLFGHREHIGTVDRAEVGPDKRGRAIVRFSRSPLGEQKFQDVKDRILTKTSVGYDLNGAEYVVDGEREGIPVYRFRNWQPYEVTLTPLPADPSVGLGRSEQQPAGPAPVAVTSTTIPIMDPVTITPETATANERTRVKDINAAANQLAGRHAQHANALRTLAGKCIEDGSTVDQFNRAVLSDVLASTPATPERQIPATVGMNQKEIKRYSILRAIRQLMDNKPLDGIERECSDELAKKLDRRPVGFFLPDEVSADRRSTRTATVSVPSAGGYLVGQEMLAGEFETLLQNNTVVVSLGARFISGLTGDVVIPRQLTGAAAYWVSETGSITSSNATFGQILARPRRIGTSVPYSKQFLAQSSLSAESFVISDSDAAIATDLDRVALRGIGGAEPLGIANLPTADKSTAVTFSTTATWAKYLEFFSNVAANNAVTGAPAYVTSVATAVKAMTIAKFSNTSEAIWKDNMIGTFRARWTTQLLTSATPVANMVIFGDFSQVIFCEWAGRDVVVDPYSAATSGNVTITIQRLIDCIIRRGKSFSTSADSGAQ